MAERDTVRGNPPAKEHKTMTSPMTNAQNKELNILIIESPYCPTLVKNFLQNQTFETQSFPSYKVLQSSN